ncbi:hypothetical protein SJI00_08885 [Pseudomonas sp. RP23018S]|uniref:hypothetical protein n=1 Tax=Pseudomonas sp. RP23018S TaxID=3096037 RepID=UPI002ACAE57B|nr:hypothetical protein [Pseudomonas sp. RP23018S]MDZ5602889.1 hypothetical protein [Pseudomonas sp. RP23018S]
MITLRKPLPPPQELDWKHGEELTSLTWTIRARNYNTFAASVIFCLLAAVALTWTVIIYTVFDDTVQPWRSICPASFFMIVLTAIYFLTHQKINFSYRITSCGIEYCTWKRNFRINPKFIGGITIFITVTLISLAATTPGLSFIAIAGPGGMVVMALIRLSLKKSQEPYSEYNHLEFKWKQITQLAIATNREVVDLQYSYIHEGHKRHWNFNIFCKKGQKDSVAAVIRSYLSPDVPCVRAKVNVPLSTD